MVCDHLSTGVAKRRQVRVIDAEEAVKLLAPRALHVVKSFVGEVKVGHVPAEVLGDKILDCQEQVQADVGHGGAGTRVERSAPISYPPPQSFLPDSDTGPVHAASATAAAALL